MVLSENSEMISVVVCICTRRRQDGLKELLESMDQLIVPPGVHFRIIVVENDTESFSEPLIKDLASKGKLEISYFLEPNQGIVNARNRSVAEAGNCDFCCFTDDDEVVTPNWLTELFKCQNEFDADGVAGPTKPSFTKKAPLYIEKFLQPDTYDYGTVVKSAFTGNLLLRKKYLDMLDGPFDIRLNFSGGEDSHLTKCISDLGGIIRFNPDAIAFETIPEDRATVKFVIKKCFRISNTRLFLNTIENKRNNPLKELPRLAMRFGYGSLILIPCLLFSKYDKLLGLTKIVKAVGGFAFFFGKKSKFYK